jgi:hypothetical protein
MTFSPKLRCTENGMIELDKNTPFLIRYSIGQKAAEEMPFLLSDIEEARDVAHNTLRFALKLNEADNGAADIFDAKGSQLGRMAVLIDETGDINHEHWTWIDGDKPHLQ